MEIAEMYGKEKKKLLMILPRKSLWVLCQEVDN